MVARNRARYLAPIALAAVVAGTYVIVHNGVTANHTSTQTSTTAKPAPGHGRFARRKFYAVQPGDNLTAIASKTGIPLTTLEALNPHVDPNSLQTGQRLRLRR